MLPYEASQVVSKIQIDLDAEIRKINPKNYDQKYTDTKQKYYKYRKKLEVKRSKKWKNVREKSGSNSKRNASSNPPNVDKDNMLLNVSHKNHSDCCYVRENLNVSPGSFLGTKMVSAANVDSNDQNVSCLKKELQLGNGERIIDLTKIKNILLQNGKLSSSRIQTSPPVRVSNSSTSRNTSNISENMFDLDFLSSQDEDLVNILEELRNRTEVSGDNITEIASSNRLKGHFCSDTIFNLSHRVLSDAEIKILEKGFHFASVQRKIKEPELRKDFEEFCRRMRINGIFGMNLLQILAIYQPWLPNLRENHLKVILIWKFF